MKQIRVALVNVPFATLYRPSIGLSLLKAALERDGHQADLHYLNLLFADRIGSLLYTKVCDSNPVALLGEWLFGASLFGPAPDLDRTYLGEVLPGFERRGISAELREAAPGLREQVEGYLEHCLTAIDWAAYDVIGFTSVFQQNVAALSLARRLKELYPDKLIAMGGANTEGIMGHALLRAFPFLDVVCNGEGDIAFPELIRRMAHGEVLSGVPAITLQEDLFRFGEATSAPVHDMDALPYPNYDDYFAALAAHPFQEERVQDVRFLFESSRGCWWGAKSHCKFCGLNGSTMAFRSKSADRALAELTYLANRYRAHTRWAAAVDNIIDMGYFRDFLPALKEMGLELNMFYETKANLTREQVQLFADAGMNAVQPGIESLSTSILRLMKKGVSALQNIQVLKWCREYGVKPYWNYLYGFPGEEPAEYERLVNMLPALSHLDAPYGCGQLRLDRFSPYFNDPDGNGITNIRPATAYRYVYTGVPAELLHHMAYYFEFDYADGRDVATYTAPLLDAVRAWKQAEGSELFSVGLGERLVIFDLRPMAPQRVHQLTGPQRQLYEQCDAIRSRGSLATALALTPAALDDLVAPLLAHHLLIEEGGNLLSLAIPLGVYSPGKAGAERFLQFLAEQRKQTGQEETAAETRISLDAGSLTSPR
ncbi:MAG: RiPP maturation radical SAM C-methyltransferase [Bacillota bacterium]